jgi:hypothetical protein
LQVFAVVEVWINGVFLIEVLCGKEVARYLDFMNTEKLARMFGPGPQASPGNG